MDRTTAVHLIRQKLLLAPPPQSEGLLNYVRVALNLAGYTTDWPSSELETSQLVFGENDGEKCYLRLSVTLVEPGKVENTITATQLYRAELEL